MSWLPPPLPVISFGAAYDQHMLVMCWPTLPRTLSGHGRVCIETHDFINNEDEY